MGRIKKDIKMATGGLRQIRAINTVYALRKREKGNKNNEILRKKPFLRHIVIGVACCARDLNTPTYIVYC